jgi:hypothetical protein
MELFLIYCAWVWIWAYLYNETKYINKSPLLSAFVGFVYTFITQLMFAKYSIGLQLFIIGIEALVLYKTYQKHMKVNKFISIKSLDIDYNIIAFLLYNVFLCINDSDLKKIYINDIIGKNKKGRNINHNISSWIQKKFNRI